MLKIPLRTKPAHKQRFVEREKKRLKWTLGLFCIGLCVPIVFIAPRVYQQVKAKTFNDMFDRTESVALRIERDLLALDPAVRNAQDKKFDQALSSIATNQVSVSAFHDVGNMFVYRDGELIRAIEHRHLPLFREFGAYRTPPVAALSDGRSAFYRGLSLHAPFENIRLEFRAQRILFGREEGLALLDYSILAISIIFGFLFARRLGLQQIELARQHRDFVSAVSHELKTPLTSIRMYSEMLASERHTDEEKRERYFGYIQTETERLRRLINNVLQLARLSNGTEEVSLKKYSVAELFEKALEVTEPIVDAAAFEFEVDCDLEEFEADEVLADEDSFCRMIINFVENAVKYSRGSLKKKVVLRCVRHSDGRSVLFSVRDHGPGISEENRTKLFEMFYRGADQMAAQTAGTGIGLAVVKELAERMDARVTASNVEPGAEFGVIFSLC